MLGKGKGGEINEPCKKKTTHVVGLGDTTKRYAHRSTTPERSAFRPFSGLSRLDWNKAPG